MSATSTILMLQRSAGNRAVSRMIADSPRQLARCAGACKCGGACKSSSSWLLPEEELQASRSVSRRPAGASARSVPAQTR
jgi:hypothetical protein